MSMKKKLGALCLGDDNLGGRVATFLDQNTLQRVLWLVSVFYETRDQHVEDS
jgi:hypothetical protein